MYRCDESGKQRPTRQRYTSYRDSLDNFGDAGAAHGAMGEPVGANTATAVVSAGDERARHLVVEANL